MCVFGVYVCVVCMYGLCVVWCVCLCVWCVCVCVCVNEKEKQNGSYLRVTELCVCGLFVVVVLVCLDSDLGVDTVMSLTQNSNFSCQFAYSSSVIRVFLMNRALLCHKFRSILICVDGICMAVLSVGAEPEESRLPCTARNSEQGAPGKPALPICHLSDRKCQDIRKDPREGKFTTFVRHLLIDCPFAFISYVVLCGVQQNIVRCCNHFY